MKKSTYNIKYYVFTNKIFVSILWCGIEIRQNTTFQKPIKSRFGLTASFWKKKTNTKCPKPKKKIVYQNEFLLY